MNGVDCMAYPQYYQQPYVQPYTDRLTQLQAPYMTPQVNQGLLWVQGEAGAKSYLVAPNTTVLLMDSEAQRFYLKSTDGSGMPNLRMFEYSELLSNSTKTLINDLPNLDDKYVTREEYDSLKSQYEQIIEKLDGIANKPKFIKGKAVQDESFI